MIFATEDERSIMKSTCPFSQVFIDDLFRAIELQNLRIKLSDTKVPPPFIQREEWYKSAPGLISLPLDKGRGRGEFDSLLSGSLEFIHPSYLSIGIS